MLRHARTLTVVLSLLAAPPAFAVVAFESITDPLSVGAFPGADALIGTADDAPGTNPDGDLAYTAVFDSEGALVAGDVGSLTLTLEGSDTVLLPSEVLEFDVESVGALSEGFDDGAAMPHRISTAADGTIDVAYTLASCPAPTERAITT